MSTSTILHLFGRLTVALVFGGLIGFQRERHGHPAGLRTHMLVALGSALITVISQSYSGPGIDPSRIAAQIVSGIGFLGAGTIIRHGQSIRGLTTAASLWAVAGIGIGAGRGGPIMWVTAFATLLALATLTVMDVVEDRFIGNAGRRDLMVLAEPGALPHVFAILVEARVTIRGMTKTAADAAGLQTTHVHVVLPPRISAAMLLERLARIDGVAHVGWAQDVDTDA